MGTCACESMVVLNTCHCGALLTRDPVQWSLCVIPRTPNSHIFSHLPPHPLSTFSLFLAGPSSSSEPQTMSGQDSAFQSLLHLLTLLAIPSPYGYKFHEHTVYIHPPSCHLTFLFYVPTLKWKKHLRVNVPMCPVT